MSRIRSHGNKTTELRFILLLRKLKITGWRRRANLPGKPDFIFREAKLAIFIDGDFLAR
jgi:G:T-mismatch repair DNA endonuclease (very short patch repair protein)